MFLWMKYFHIKVRVWVHILRMHVKDEQPYHRAYNPRAQEAQMVSPEKC